MTDIETGYRIKDNSPIDIEIDARDGVTFFKFDGKVVRNNWRVPEKCLDVNKARYEADNDFLKAHGISLDGPLVAPEPAPTVTDLRGGIVLPEAPSGYAWALVKVP